MEKSFVCKLWNDTSELPVDKGQTVVVTNVLTKTWKEEMTISSTDFTDVEVSLHVYIAMYIYTTIKML